MGLFIKHGEQSTQRVNVQTPELLKPAASEGADMGAGLEPALLPLTLVRIAHKQQEINYAVDLISRC